jgi:hypothetical protein
MAKRSFWKRQLRLELLESRETPTALAGAHPLTGLAINLAAQPAPHSKGVVFRGTEQVTFSAPVPQSSSGPAVLSGSGSGNVSDLGSFKSQVTATIAFDFRSFSVTETFQATNGDKVFATINGHYQHRINNSSATATLLVTGGTGNFANAIGHGTVIISPILPSNFPNSRATLTFHGRVTL